jgi:hypothetical protein
MHENPERVPKERSKENSTKDMYRQEQLPRTQKPESRIRKDTMYQKLDRRLVLLSIVILELSSSGHGSQPGDLHLVG